MRPLALSTLLAGLLSLISCAPSADIKIPERKLPNHFARASAGNSAASVSWKTYFADPQLTKLIAGALSGSPDVQIALQHVQLARAGVRHATGARLPQLSLNAGVGISKAGRYTADGAGNASTEITPGRTVPTNLGDLSLGLQSTWELDVWGRLKSLRQSALAQYLASVEGTNWVVTQLVSDIASAYFELVALDHRRDVLTLTVQRQREAVDVVRLQKQAGRANELAVQQFEAQLASTRSLEEETVRRIHECENQINLLRGAYQLPVARTTASQLHEVAGTIAAGVPSQLLHNRPDIREAELLVEASKWDLQVARAAFFPTLSISAGVGFRAFDPKYLFYTPESLTYSAGANLLAPLVNRSAIEAQFDAATARQVQAMYNYQKIVLTAFAEVANGLSDLEHRARIVEIKKEQSAAVRQTVETADMLYRAGQAGYFEVLMAQQNTLAAELELIDAMRDQRFTSVSLYRALGGGWS